jgi:hypothetical protein
MLNQANRSFCEFRECETWSYNWKRRATLRPFAIVANAARDALEFIFRAVARPLGRAFFEVGMPSLTVGLLPLTSQERRPSGVFADAAPFPTVGVGAPALLLHFGQQFLVQIRRKCLKRAALRHG